MLKYNSEWAKAYSIPPAQDSIYSPPQPNSEEAVLKKRIFLDNYGHFLQAQKDIQSQQFGTAVRLYCRLVNPEHNAPSKHCFYVAADLPNKKKLAQIERQSKSIFTGTGMTVVSKLVLLFEITSERSLHSSLWDFHATS